MFIQKCNGCLLESNFTECPIFHLATLVRLEFKTERFTIIEEKKKKTEVIEEKMEIRKWMEFTSRKQQVTDYWRN